MTVFSLHELELTVGDVVQLGDYTVTVIDLDNDEITFRILEPESESNVADEVLVAAVQATMGAREESSSKRGQPVLTGVQVIRSSETPDVLLKTQFASNDSDVMDLRFRQIEELYSHAETLAAQRIDSPNDAELRRLFVAVLAKLRQLQHEEAAAVENHILKGLSLPLGSGAKALAEARDILAKYADPSTKNSAAE